MSLQQHLGYVQDIHGIAASTKYSQVEKVRDLCLSSFIPILPTGHIAIVNKKNRAKCTLRFGRKSINKSAFIRVDN